VSKLAVLLLLAGFGSNALAATCVTVEQVEQFLSASHELPDAKLAAKISDLELTERASSLRLSRWQAEFPGKRTREALLALADASAFFDLPPAEIPAIEKPDPETRKQIFLRAIDYVHATLPKLPNFIARRSTAHFDDVSPFQQALSQYMADRSNGFHTSMDPPTALPTSGPQPFRAGERSSVIVTYRDGHEVADSPALKDKKSDGRTMGFTTSGEFGPILSVVMGDVIHGKLYWSHWEQGPGGPLAVFRYTVPIEMSHYTVIGVGDHPQLPAYHGEIAVDPSIGTVMRLTLVAELKPPWQAWESSIMVEYGPVEIGGGTYTCPLRSVALSRLPNSNYELPKQNEVNPETTKLAVPPQTFLNDVAFTDYHVFRGDVRVSP
jgi:hypothetical protein